MIEFSSSLFVPIVLIWPLLLVGAMIFRNMHATILPLMTWAALPAFLLAVFAPADISVHLPVVMLGVELRLTGDSDRLFLLFTAFLWLISAVYARYYISDQADRKRFLVYFLLSMTGNLGLVLAYDLMSFYLFFALMSFASYGLVVHDGNTEALRAGRIYIILVVIGEVALFSAMILTAISVGSTDFDVIRQNFVQVESRNLILFLAFLGFGIKAGFLGLHVWLPLAHPVAPTPASAVLSGAMIKAGLLGWLRLLPLGDMAMFQWGELFIVLGILSAFYGVIVGVSQNAPKAVLAYSSISQMGIMTVALGFAMMSPQAYPGIVLIITLFAMHHGLCKGALFLGVGVLSACNGLQRRSIWLILWLPALALSGAPLTSGMAAKGLLKAQTITAPDPWNSVLETFLPLSSVATTLLVGRFLYLLATPKKENKNQASLPGLILPLGALIIASVALPWWFTPESFEIFTLSTFINSFWPVLLGVTTTLFMVLWGNRRNPQVDQITTSDSQKPMRNPSPLIPPGDVLVPINFLLILIIRKTAYVTNELLPQWRDNQLSALNKLGSGFKFWQFLGQVESTLRYWPVPMVILIMLGLTLAILGVIT